MCARALPGRGGVAGRAGGGGGARQFLGLSWPRGEWPRRTRCGSTGRTAGLRPGPQPPLRIRAALGLEPTREGGVGGGDAGSLQGRRRPPSPKRNTRPRLPGCHDPCEAFQSQRRQSQRRWCSDSWNPAAPTCAARGPSGPLQGRRRRLRPSARALGPTLLIRYDSAPPASLTHAGTPAKPIGARPTPAAILCRSA